MNKIFYKLTEDFRLFGLKIFSKTTIYDETCKDGIKEEPETYFINENYFKSEFKLDK